MDYKELIDELRTAGGYGGECWGPSSCRSCAMAADVIETLLAERDAAVEGLRGVCRLCVNAFHCANEQPCCECTHITGVAWDADNWQWRGPQKGDTA